MGQSVFFCLSNGCCSKVIGVVTFDLWTGTNALMPGTNLIADPFYQVDETVHGFEVGESNPYYTPMNTAYTNYGGVSWSPGEPTIGLAEGFILISATNHSWIQRFSPLCSGE